MVFVDSELELEHSGCSWLLMWLLVFVAFFGGVFLGVYITIEEAKESGCPYVSSYDKRVKQALPKDEEAGR